MFEFCASFYTLRSHNGIQGFIGIIEKLWLKSQFQELSSIQCHNSGASQTQPLNLKEKHGGVLTQELELP